MFILISDSLLHDVIRATADADRLPVYNDADQAVGWCCSRWQMFRRVPSREAEGDQNGARGRRNLRHMLVSNPREYLP